MAEIEGYGCTGVLIIGGIVMNGPAWDISDLTDLWFTADVRGDDRILPGVAGVIPYRRRTTVTRHDLTILVIGDVDATGAPHSDSYIGLETNISSLYTNVVTPTNTGDGTRAASLVLPSGATRTANIHILGLVKQRQFLSDYQSALEATLQISIPAGRFV